MPRRMFFWKSEWCDEAVGECGPMLQGDCKARSKRWPCASCHLFHVTATFRLGLFIRLWLNSAVSTSNARRWRSADTSPACPRRHTSVDKYSQPRRMLESVVDVLLRLMIQDLWKCSLLGIFCLPRLSRIIHMRSVRTPIQDARPMPPFTTPRHHTMPLV